MTITKIGRYNVQSELGHGGMASVYRAFDPSFKRDVAIKVLPSQFQNDPNFRARFEREAQTIAALEHPAIVPVYDYGEQDGQPYLVMRLMTGGSLSDRIAKGPLSLKGAVDILARIAPALDRAHELGITHRDLKPANILFDGDGNPYISDFGIAKLTQANTQLSQTGMMGTPAYMSPEQARGDKQIDGRADLYGLGAVLYHMLSGQLPYESDTPMGMAFKHVTEPPPRLLDIRPELPAACGAVVAKAMAKEPDQRYATAAELLSALQTVLRANDAQPTATPMPLGPPPTVLVNPASVAGPGQAAPPTPARSFPVMPVVLAGLGLLAVAAVALFIVTAIALFGPRGASPTAVANRSPTAAVTIVLPSATPAPKRTVAATANLGATASAKAITAAPATTAAPTAISPTQPPTAAASAAPPAGATQVSSADQMVEVFVPAGPFTMGNNAGAADQRPAHTVNLSGFWIDRTEVTNALYALCVAAGACTAPQETRSISRPSYFGNAAFDNFPVLFVSWNQAKAYCGWAGRRLPTEAEWEKAARGTDGRLYPWGNDAPDRQRLNFGRSGVGDTVAVGQYPSNASPYGALDMAGNASEWVADFYDPNYYAVSPADNPTGPAKTGCSQGECRVLRGGDWNSKDDQVTTTARLFYGPNDSRDAFTIRCARS